MVRGWVLVHCGQFGELWLLPATEVQKSSSYEKILAVIQTSLSSFNGSALSIKMTSIRIINIQHIKLRKDGG
jgi:hypothetical protein